MGSNIKEFMGISLKSPKQANSLFSLETAKANKQTKLYRYKDTALSLVEFGSNLDNYLVLSMSHMFYISSLVSAFKKLCLRSNFFLKPGI